MEIKQSFLFSVSRAQLTLYEQRLLVRIVESCQTQLSDLKLKDNLKQLEHQLENVPFSVPISSLLDEGSKHYELVQDAVIRLQARTIQYYSFGRKTWYTTSVIYNVSITKGSGIIKFYVSKNLLDCLFDFSKGFSVYTLEKILSLPSAYSMRMYAILCNQQYPISYSLDTLRSMFDTDDKYKLNADFIKKVIDSSKDALNKCGCNSFTYKKEYEGHKIKSILFYPVKNEVREQTALLAKISIRQLVKNQILVILTNYLKFSSKELSAHKRLLEALDKRPDGVELLQDIAHRCLKKGAGKGYVINAIKKAIDFED